ncbi:MAG TPA: type II toxin-antitoxin system prevent-host-death family antitoxin [Thermoanaerobaculia bacterium]|nr:type II toxin-antitoxin system prevent-host-death family antitoxin [Thermoanaerobaculia bacterium]
MGAGKAAGKPKGQVIEAGEFKARCLQLLDEVRDQQTEITITKDGRPIAKLVPVEKELPDSFGALAGTVTIEGDIVEADHETWDDPDT